MNNLFLNNNIFQDMELDNDVTPEKQNNFLESTLGKAINGAVDLGIKSLMPDFIENEIIEIKDCLINEGFEQGINKAINNAIEIGRNILGIFDCNFLNVEQAEKAVMDGGIIDGISNVLDFVLNKVDKNTEIPNEIINFIKEGKDFILEKIEDRIKENFNIQDNKVADINNHMNSWKEYFSSQNLEMMNITYEKIQDSLGEIMPLEDILKTAKEIENLQTVINNNDGDFLLSKEQMELSKILI